MLQASDLGHLAMMASGTALYPRKSQASNRNGGSFAETPFSICRAAAASLIGFTSLRTVRGFDLGDPIAFSEVAQGCRGFLQPCLGRRMGSEFCFIWQRLNENPQRQYLYNLASPFKFLAALALDMLIPEGGGHTGAQKPRAQATWCSARS